MNPTALFDVTASAPTMLRTTVAAVHDDGTVSVHQDDGGLLQCDVLAPGGGAPFLTAGDTVLVWRPNVADELGVVLGRIGVSTTAATPDTLVIEARKNLTLRCGEGSITFRDDGKILIKGKDLVSHAKRMNRVKGGAVAIN